MTLLNKYFVFASINFLFLVASLSQAESTNCSQLINSIIETVNNEHLKKEFSEAISELESQLLLKKNQTPAIFRDTTRNLTNVVLNSIESPEDAFAFVDLLTKSRSVLLSISGGEGRYDTRNFLDLIDFATSIAKIREQFTDAQKQILIKKWAYLKSLDLRPVHELDNVIATVLDHKEIYNIIDSISNRKLMSLAYTRKHSSLLTPSFFSTLNQLSDDERIAARTYALKKYSSITKDEELTTIMDGDGVGPKTVKRNLETIASILSHPELQELQNKISSLSIPISRTDAEELINEFYAKTHNGLEQPRGNYSFEQVLNVAEIIQKNLNLLDNEENYIQIYGSFANGKAILTDSDIDIHLSDSLALNYLNTLTVFTTNFYDISYALNHKPKDMHDAIKEMQKTFIDTENAIVKSLNRESYTKGEVLTMVVENPGNGSVNFGKMENYAFYNPIVVKVTKDKTWLQIWDGISNQLKEIEINIKVRQINH